MNLAKVQALVSRRFDRLNMHGLGFSDFMILYLLHQAGEERMRRIDLADRIGLTASGITRMLLPLEKNGLLKREINERDARVSYVVLTTAGKRLFNEALDTANEAAKDLLPAATVKAIKPLSDILATLGGNIS
ncbi:MarR family transcriptional regulator [Deminuibacter soli]|uniref:MarR family transcriptional regulator n=2 Tax=Deminuibacter soli TaxID=2291815 RepID=A0A3E1NGZ4_9BACT|nr:MarR family transcriptional regulator [Deminuibacter soli]